METEIVVTSQKKIMIVLKTPSGRKGILNMAAHKDGSVFITCSNIFLKAEEYKTGVFTFPPGVKHRETIPLNETEGFVITSILPKISLHPSGYVQASFSDPRKVEDTRQVFMERKLEDMRLRQILYCRWENINQFEEAPSQRIHTFTLDYEHDTDIKNYNAYLSVSGFLEDFPFLSGLKEKIAEILPKIERGKFIIFNIDVRTRDVRFNIAKDNVERKASGFDISQIIFGIKTLNDSFIWYKLGLPNPNEFELHSMDTYASFMFQAAFKNFGEREVRKTGEMLTIIGLKKLLKNN